MIVCKFLSILVLCKTKLSLVDTSVDSIGSLGKRYNGKRRESVEKLRDLAGLPGRNV